MSGELITADGQMQYKNYLLGDDEITFLDAINGWEDFPAVDSGNTLRPAAHGAWSGKKYAGQRIITWEGRFAPDSDSWVTELKALRNAFNLPLGTEEEEIVIRLHEETFLAYGAVIARAIPGDKQFGYYGAKLVLQFECSDPRRYSLEEYQWDLTFPAATEDGLFYPLSYDLYYGTASSPPSGTLTNDGNMLTPVVIDITGPVTNPSVTNQTLGVKLEFEITLLEGETLTVDTRTGTVLLNETADRISTRTTDSAPVLMFGLNPGDNHITTAANSWDTPASVIFRWRDATL